MRLLLDEHFSPEIATELRRLGYDAVACDAAGLGGSSDEELLAAAAEQGRVVLSNNARHFAALARRWAAEGRSHAGIVLTADRSLPRSKGTIGLYIELLRGLADGHPAEAALRDQVLWLRTAP